MSLTGLCNCARIFIGTDVIVLGHEEVMPVKQFNTWLHFPEISRAKE